MQTSIEREIEKAAAQKLSHSCVAEIHPSAYIRSYIIETAE